MALTVRSYGSLVLVSPDHEDAAALNEWCDDNVAEFQFFGPALVVEPRYVGPLLEGLSAEGFEITLG